METESVTMPVKYKICTKTSRYEIEIMKYGILMPNILMK